ncbi:MAG TPA: universal stress protein [Actinomycetota bacterium]
MSAVYSKVLIATDGSATASAASRVGADLASAVGARALLLYVGDVAEGERVLRETREALGIDAETKAVAGHAADKILEIAEAEGADLIVVGNKGMSGARRFLLGSVPNQVSHNAPCNVLIVKTT